jgi:hypothetical protein
MCRVSLYAGPPMCAPLCAGPLIWWAVYVVSRLHTMSRTYTEPPMRRSPSTPCRSPGADWVRSVIRVRRLFYFSPRLPCRFDLAVRAISIGRRIASDRVGLSFCCLAQALKSLANFLGRCRFRFPVMMHHRFARINLPAFASARLPASRCAFHRCHA